MSAPLSGTGRDPSERAFPVDEAERRSLRRIFHGAFYRLLHPEAGPTDEAAFEHYLAIGVAANNRPHPLFDPGFYLKANQDVAASGTPAILHYLRYGGREWRVFSPVVDLDAYWGLYRIDVALTETGSVLEDFAVSPERLRAFAFFDADHYRAASAASTAGAELPGNRLLDDFFGSGIAAGRDPHPLIELRRIARGEGFAERLRAFEMLFAADHPLRHVPTHVMVDPAVYAARQGTPSVHPVVHFLRHGTDGTDLSPHPLFDPVFYCRTYGMPHSAAALTAFVRGGIETTSPNAFFDPVYYRAAHGSAIAAGETAIEHYMRLGHLPWFSPSPRFAQRYYLTHHPEVALRGERALVHFLTTGRAKGYAARPPAPRLDRTRGLPAAAIVAAIRAKARNAVGRPEVSVIVPVYGALDVTLRCVLSLVGSSDATPFEIVVVDDASPDGSGATLAAALDGLPGIRVVRNETNLGFVRTCNAAAATSSAPSLYFLNNDTVVLDGWLDELVGTFRDEPDTGLVGAKLVYPDGRLQEAGGIVWADGSAANYGRLDDPEAPAFNYLRDVDYVSGAAILVRTEAWKAASGFSEAFVPAYYEDADLAMKLRAAGWRVRYQPLAVVVHEEGVSSGTDLSAGVKRHQVINRETFVSAWREALAGNGRSGDLSRPVVDRRARARILFFDAEIPMPDRDAGSVLVFHYLLILSRLGYRVSFLAENLHRYGAYGNALRRFGVEVLSAPYVEDAADYVLSRGGEYDMIVLSRAPVGGRILPAVKAAFPSVPVVFDTIDLHHLRLRRKYEQTRDEADLHAALAMKRMELDAIRAADATLVVSEVEAAVVRAEIGPFPHVVVPLIYPPYVRRNGFAERRDVAFVGGFRHTPNVDAAQFLVERIWPRVRAEPGMEGARLHIIGSMMPPEVERLAGDDVLAVGYVEDLDTYLEGIRVTVAPLRYGAGIKGKVGNSLRLGVPVVATPIGVEGMHLEDGRHVLVAAGEQPFAEAVARLYRDEALWKALSGEGKRFAEERFGIASATERIRELCASLLGATAAPAEWTGA